MDELEPLKAQIREAFAELAYPGDDRIRGSDMGCEPFEVEEKFRGQRDWRALEPAFIDDSAALAFLSAAAFRFYLPAYLLADLAGALCHADPAFFLYHGLDDETRHQAVNPRLYGEQTWFEAMQEKLSMFTRSEAAAIAAYLRWRAEQTDWDEERRRIESALRSYWLARAGLPAG